MYTHHLQRCLQTAWNHLKRTTRNSCSRSAGRRGASGTPESCTKAFTAGRKASRRSMTHWMPTAMATPTPARRLCTPTRAHRHAGTQALYTANSNTRMRAQASPSTEAVYNGGMVAGPFARGSTRRSLQGRTRQGAIFEYWACMLDVSAKAVYRTWMWMHGGAATLVCKHTTIALTLTTSAYSCCGLHSLRSTTLV